MVAGSSNSPHIYLTQALCIGLFLTSPVLATLWRRRPALVIITAGVFAALLAYILILTTPAATTIRFVGRFDTGLTPTQVITTFTLFMAVTLVLFARRFAHETDHPDPACTDFFTRLDTPVDVQTEVTGSAAAALSIYKLIGALIFLIAGLVLVVMAVEMVASSTEDTAPGKYLLLTGILVIMALFFLIAGRPRKQ